MVTQGYKGTRDFYPEDKRLQKWMFSKIRSAVEKYGYEEYDAPVIESTEIYNLKGSAEIVNEQSYTFIDRGGRSVTLRTEMTPSVSRMVAARRQHLIYPLRWYSIPNLWRYERPQKGRLREFWQLNVDLFGLDSEDADVEIIQVADSILREFGAKSTMYEIKISSRKFIDYLLIDYLNLSKVQSDTIRRLIDKKNKMSPDEFAANVESVITPSQREGGLYDKLIKVLEESDFEKLPEGLMNNQGISKIYSVIKKLNDVGILNVKFDPTLVRGFDYYNDLIFEIFDTNPQNNRAMYGGGRYDGLVELFGVDKVPTIGFGMGDVTLEHFLRDNDLIPVLKTETELCVMLAGEVKANSVLKQIKMLREEGVKTILELSDKKMSKKLEICNKKQIPYVLIIGDEELKNEQYLLKDMIKKTEKQHSLERIISIIKANTQNTDDK